MPKYFFFSYLNSVLNASQLHVVQIGHQAPDPPFVKKAVDVYFPPEATNDFPVAMQVSKKHGIVYLVTKFGFIHLYDLDSGACIYMNRISGETIFVTAEHEATNGIIGVNKKGQVLSVNVDEQTVIPYVLTTLNNTELAFKLASRGNLPGADDLYIKQYQALFQSGQYGEAAKVAANSPRVNRLLHSRGRSHTFYRAFFVLLKLLKPLNLLLLLPEVSPPFSSTLAFFSRKVNSTTWSPLNWRVQSYSKEESNYWRNGSRKTKYTVLPLHFFCLIPPFQLTCSEELGDIVRTHDMTLALSVYLRANVPNKVIACFAETGQTEKIVLYAKKVGYQPDYTALLQHIMRANPDKGAEFATQLVNDENGPQVDIERVTLLCFLCFLRSYSFLGCRYLHVAEHDPTSYVVLA